MRGGTARLYAREPGLEMFLFLCYQVLYKTSRNPKFKFKLWLSDDYEMCFSKKERQYTFYIIIC